MTTLKTQAAPDSGAEGCWTIQIVLQDRNQVGHRYVCRARNDTQAQSIALQLAGSSRSTVGYDYHRMINPSALYAKDLALGCSQSIDNPETWAALQPA